MRRKKLFYTIGLICFWCFMTYFIVIRSNSSNVGQKSKFLEKLEYLENGINTEIDKRDKLLKSISIILKSNDKKEDFLPTTQITFSDNFDIKEKEEDVQENNEESIEIRTHLSDGSPAIAVLLMACNRVSVERTLADLINFREDPEQFPIVVSQDCGDEATKNTILSYKDKIHYMAQPDLSDFQLAPKEKKFKGYYKISRHYGWALNTTFAKFGFEYVIVVEDDLNIAPDFYEYFLGTLPLLQQDKSLWCVSAWNDNGKPELIDESKPELLYRSDFFPGLGWMLTKELWDNELGKKWPKAYWDDWIRQPQQRMGRACIRPELPRTTTFGKIGVSNGEFFDKHLKFLRLNHQMVRFSKMDLSYLLKENYDEDYKKTVYQCPVVTFEELRRGLITTKDPVRIQYTSLNQYKIISKMLGLMDDSKSGVPRTAYLGIVSFIYQKRRVYLAPSTNWNGYEPSR